jgi:hypothetical protein
MDRGEASRLVDQNERAFGIPSGVCKMKARREFVRPLLLAALLLAGTASAGLAQVGKLLPADEAVQNPEFFAFRARLQAAVARHDTAALLEVVDPNIKIGFGGNDGIEAFKSKWKLQEGGSSLLWDELGLVLALGGSFRDANNFVAPYVFSRWPEKADAFEHVAVLGSNVRVRAEPRAGSRVLAALSFDIVPLADSGRSRLTPEQAREWTSVKLRDGRTGYISSRYVRSSIAHRAFLTRKDGSWRLTLFVAGD